MAKVEKQAEKAQEVEISQVDAALSDNPELAAELESLTEGEKIIRLRQKGLIGFDVQ